MKFSLISLFLASLLVLAGCNEESSGSSSGGGSANWADLVGVYVFEGEDTDEDTDETYNYTNYYFMEADKTAAVAFLDDDENCYDISELSLQHVSGDRYSLTGEDEEEAITVEFRLFKNANGLNFQFDEGTEAFAEYPNGLWTLPVAVASVTLDFVRANECKNDDEDDE